MILSLPALTEAQPAARCSGPLSEAQLTALVKGSVPATRVRQLVASCGIDFEPNGAAISRLRSAGVPETALDAVRVAAPADASAIPPATIIAGRTKANPKDGLTYVWIPPGTFMMGCSPGDTECFAYERPAHWVTIKKGFWYGQTLVTQQAYQRVTGQNPSSFNGANLPVEQVNWDEAKAYCAAIGGRLPTEAEWEYAARAGSTGARYGNLNEIAWYSGRHEVGQKQANAFGLYDTLGNVWQWTADWFGDYLSGAQSDPSGVARGQYRVMRGGTWSDSPQYVRVSDRDRYEPGGSNYYIGLRCVGE